MQALAEHTAQNQAQITPVAAKNNYGSVTYPVLDRYPDAAVQDTVNKAIYDTAQIETRLNTLNRLEEGGWGLQVNYKDTFVNNILSVSVSAYGEMPGGRMGQIYSTVNYNLATGQPIAVTDLFTDAEGAFSFMEQKLEDEVRPLLSGYLENDALTPIPRDNFFLTPYGITFYYPQDQFSLLSGYSGGCSFDYFELKDYLNLSEGSILKSLGAGEFLSITPDTAARIAKDASQGILPGIGAAIGDSLIERLDEYRLLVEPDYYPGGRFFEVEVPEMRCVWLLTDALTDSYDQNQVLGLRADRINLYGIQTGITTIEEWRAVLGQPESSAAVDETTAEDYRLSAGTSDYYTFGENKLRLHANAEGVLESVQLLR
jgi:hypothetical protein